MPVENRRAVKGAAAGAGAESLSRGRFIVVEGAEGVGKTTQVRRLAAFLEGAGLPLVVAREPGGTGVGEGIRNLVLHGSGGPVPRESELLLILAARAAFVRLVVGPALGAGQWVLSDRFDLSSLAYQGYGRGIELDRVSSLNEFATGGLAPDLYLVLDLAVEEGLARQVRAAKAPDRFEAESSAFRQAVRRGYLELARSIERAVVVPAGGSPDEVEDRIRREIIARFPETFGGGEIRE